MIAEEQRCKKREILVRGVRMRMRYRKYFASRKPKDAIRLDVYNEVSPRARVHYQREYTAYLGNR